MLGLDRGFLSLEIETLNPGETIFAWGFGGLRPPNPPGKARVDFGFVFFGSWLRVFRMLPPFFSDFGLRKSGSGPNWEVSYQTTGLYTPD